MIINDSQFATLLFKIDGIDNKNDAYIVLKQFLKTNDWLTSDERKKSPLHSYHSTIDGICVITLENNIDDISDHIDDLFTSLSDCHNIKWIKAVYNKLTEKLIYNNIDKYPCQQTIDIVSLKDNDEVVVFFRR